MKKTLLLLALLMGAVAFPQTGTTELPAYDIDTLMKPRKTNPVIFADILFGGAGGSSHGLALGGTFNYEYRKNLFTLRYTNLTDFNARLISPVIPLPVFYVEEEINEGALLFGRRYTDYNVAYSFSAGVSANWRKTLAYSDNKGYYYSKSTMAGVPFEVSVKWFKVRRRPYHIYGVIPIGPPVALGHSFGFKLFGNISGTSFVGIGITWGWGFHKQY